MRIEEIGPATLINGDCRDVMRSMDENSVDAIVTDPPAGISFMGKSWDHDKGGRDQWIAWLAECLREAERLLKPGGLALVWALPRTSHWTGMAVEDAGLLPVDMVIHLFGTGFPKHQSKLKPAWEGWWLCRKKGPVQKLNIDACRIPVTTADDAREFEFNHNGCNRSKTPEGEKLGMFDGGWKVRKGDILVPEGRYPANVTHDGSDDVLALFPESKGQLARARTDGAAQGNNVYASLNHVTTNPEPRSDAGSAARFFYCSKASRTDRNEGCEAIEKKPLNLSAGTQNPGSFQAEGTDKTAHNSAPTVKSTELMRYLCRLVTPPGGTVLDPFMGSGSTGKAALKEGFAFVGIELDEEHGYFDIACSRIRHVHES